MPTSETIAPTVPPVALVLAGGLGLRLRSVVSDRPKVLAEVAGSPFILHLLQWLAAAGVQRSILCTGYQAPAVRERIPEQLGQMRVDCSAEPRPLGTAGALRWAVQELDVPHVLALNGDSWCALDLAELASSSAASGAEASLCVLPVDDVAQYGSVALSEIGRIRSFDEKGQRGPGLINAGVYILPTTWLGELERGATVSLEHDALPHWVRRGIYGHRVDVPFVDIGTPASLASADTVVEGERR